MAQAKKSTSKKTTNRKKTREPEQDLDIFQGDEAGTGFEGTDMSDYVVPFITLLQSNSDEVMEGTPKYIEGAKAGMMLNRATGELTKEMVIVPCYHKKCHLEWISRDAGGGFVKEHPFELPEVTKGRIRDTEGSKLFLDDGHYLEMTVTYFCVREDADESENKIVIPMSSTKLASSRQLMTTASNLKMTDSKGEQFTPVLWSHRYKMTTIPKENKKGRWFIYHFELIGKVNEELFLESRDFRKIILNGGMSLIGDNSPTNPQITADESQY